MLALAAAAVLFLALILDLFDVKTGDWNSWTTLVTLALLLLSLHLAGIASDWRRSRANR